MRTGFGVGALSGLRSVVSVHVVVDRVICGIADAARSSRRRRLDEMTVELVEAFQVATTVPVAHQIHDSDAWPFESPATWRTVWSGRPR
jgi:hypothetical protein